SCPLLNALIQLIMRQSQSSFCLLPFGDVQQHTTESRGMIGFEIRMKHVPDPNVLSLRRNHPVFNLIIGANGAGIFHEIHCPFAIFRMKMVLPESLIASPFIQRISEHSCCLLAYESKRMAFSFRLPNNSFYRINKVLISFSGIS